MNTEPLIACIVGPTACGKTALSVRLAKRLNAEIVSADSVQVYRGFDIGSAKPTQAERAGVAHHLIDCADADESDFSVSRYVALAKAAIEQIRSREKLPLITGGSGLYVNALTYPLRFAAPACESVRAELNSAYEKSPETLCEQLRRIDPDTAARLHPNDKKRIVRALEVYLVSGRTLSEHGNDFANTMGASPPFRAAMIGLTMPRDMLYARIDTRVDEMCRSGLVDEARTIYHAGYARSLPAMQSIGYRQLFRHFDGDSTLTEAIEDIKRETRRFAKRQITWFKRDARIVWLDALSSDLVQQAEEALLIEMAKQEDDRYADQ